MVPWFNWPTLRVKMMMACPMENENHGDLASKCGISPYSMLRLSVGIKEMAVCRFPEEVYIRY